MYSSYSCNQSYHSCLKVLDDVSLPLRQNPWLVRPFMLCLSEAAPSSSCILRFPVWNALDLLTESHFPRQDRFSLVPGPPCAGASPTVSPSQRPLPDLLLHRKDFSHHQGLSPLVGCPGALVPLDFCWSTSTLLVLSVEWTDAIPFTSVPFGPLSRAIFFTCPSPAQVLPRWEKPS